MPSGCGASRHPGRFETPAEFAFHLVGAVAGRLEITAEVVRARGHGIEFAMKFEQVNLGGVDFP